MSYENHILPLLIGCLTRLNSENNGTTTGTYMCSMREKLRYKSLLTGLLISLRYQVFSFHFWAAKEYISLFFHQAMAPCPGSSSILFYFNSFSFYFVLRYFISSISILLSCIVSYLWMHPDLGHIQYHLWSPTSSPSERNKSLVPLLKNEIIRIIIKVKSELCTKQNISMWQWEKEEKKTITGFMRLMAWYLSYQSIR